MNEANATRGESAITLDGLHFVLRPSWEAIQAIERQTGKGLIQLAREGLDGALISHEVAVIVTECIKAWGAQTANTEAAGVNAKRVGQLINSAEGGLLGVMQTVGALLVGASTGGYTATGEVKPATTKDVATPAAG